MEKILREIEAGRDSGFSSCCIFYYLLRSRFIEHILTWKRWDKYFGESFRKEDKKWRHIVCPVCELKYKILNKEPTYYHCKSCYWTQFENSSCNYCVSPKKRKKHLEWREKWKAECQMFLTKKKSAK